MARQVSLERGFPGNGGRLEELGAMLEASAEPPSKALRREERFERLKKALGALSPVSPFALPGRFSSATSSEAEMGPGRPPSRI